MLDYLIEKDRELFLILNQLGSPRWDGFWLVLTDKVGIVSLLLYVLLLYLGFKALGPKRLFFLLVAVALMITTTDQLANFFKDGFQRLRPCHDPILQNIARLVKAYCGGKFSYFSAHAANTMAVAVFFSRILIADYQRLWALVVPWAVLVGYSRIYIGVHFPLDVITGMGIGAVFGWIFAKLSIFATHKITYDIH